MNLDTPRARALYKSMIDARAVFVKAQTDYHGALDMMLDCKGSPDGVYAHRREGRTYAQALTAYLDATMAWLGYTDPPDVARKEQGRG